MPWGAAEQTKARRKPRDTFLISIPPYDLLLKRLEMAIFINLSCPCMMRCESHHSLWLQWFSSRSSLKIHPYHHTFASPSQMEFSSHVVHWSFRWRHLRYSPLSDVCTAAWCKYFGTENCKLWNTRGDQKSKAGQCQGKRQNIFSKQVGAKQYVKQFGEEMTCGKFQRLITNHTQSF